VSCQLRIRQCGDVIISVVTLLSVWWPDWWRHYQNDDWWRHYTCNDITFNVVTSLSMWWHNCQCGDVTVSAVTSLSVRWRHYQCGGVTINMVTSLSIWWRHYQYGDVNINMVTSLSIWWSHYQYGDFTISVVTSISVWWRHYHQTTGIKHWCTMVKYILGLQTDTSLKNYYLNHRNSPYLRANLLTLLQTLAQLQTKQNKCKCK
jgi:hypothetical protein